MKNSLEFDSLDELHSCLRPIQDLLCLNDGVIESNIAKNSSGTVDIDNRAKLLNRIAEYAVLIFINRNYYKQSTITCDDEVMHYGKPSGTVIKTGTGIGEIDQSTHAEALKHARKLISQLGE